MAEVNQQWIELIQTGGIETFFKTHPNDEDLANHFNDAFGGETPITPEMVRRDRKRYYSRPHRGDQLDEEEASPTKNVIRNKAMQLSVREALAEILDNIFDNFERNLPGKLKVDITAYPATAASPGELLISENSGGIEKKRIVPLIQLGFSERSARGIGAWGEGFKMAVFALGEEVEVFSAFPDEEPISIHFPRSWLDPSHVLWKKWKVNTYTVPTNPPSFGKTVIRVNHLHEQVLGALGLANPEDRGANI